MSKQQEKISRKKNEHGLTDRQETFIAAYVENGGNATQAAITAGYAESGAYQRGHEILRNQAALARMESLVREKMYKAAPLAVESLMKLAVSASSDTVKQAAASSLLDRTGYKVPVKVEITDNRTAAQVDAELAALLDMDVAEISPVSGSQAVSGDNEGDQAGNGKDNLH